MNQIPWRSELAQRVPTAVKKRISAFRLRRARLRNAAKSVDAVFEQVYQAGIWGRGDTFDSGSGSRGAAATAYTDFIRSLISAEGARSVVDIGCGDFRVAEQFVNELEIYHGIDVVEQLVQRNNNEYGREGVSFACLDASIDELPKADVCLVRQVFQHLSNAQVSRILDRCRQFPIVVITEHWASPDFAAAPNLDKTHGPDTRLDTGSYVDVTRPPFDIAPIEDVLQVNVDQPLYHAGETIRTAIWRP